MEFAKVHKDWPVNKWRNILWTDESKIVMFGGTGSREYSCDHENSSKLELTTLGRKIN